VTRPANPQASDLFPSPSVQTLIPSRTECTSVRLNCGSRLDDAPVPVRGRFIWSKPTEIPACWLKRSPSAGRTSGSGQWGEGVIFPSSSSSSSSSSSYPEESVSEGVSSPCALTAARAALQSRLLYLGAYCLSLSARLASCLATSSGKVTPMPWIAASIPKTLHKDTYALKKQKLTQSERNELKKTHPGADDSFP
jgi:hypothetical protein